MRKPRTPDLELFEHIRDESERIRIETRQFEERWVAVGEQIDRVLRKHRDDTAASASLDRG